MQNRHAVERVRASLDLDPGNVVYGRPVCLQALIDRQLQVRPEALAISFGAMRVSYRELDERSNRFARFLEARGVTTETIVGVHVDRSDEMVVALLGILKAGGAYLPLDPSLPAERIAFMLEDARVPLVVTQQTNRERLPSTCPDLVLVDEDREAIASQSSERFDTDVTAENLAYVIYTSGSTGRPKGVMIEHRALFNYIQWCRYEYGFEEEVGSIVHSPLSFDLTVTSLWGPLVSGAAVELLPESARVEDLAAALTDGTPRSLVKLTPAHLTILSIFLRKTVDRVAIRTFVVGGEALLSEHVDFWIRRVPGVRIVNEYGPTEATVGCSTHDVATTQNPDRIPIGRPIANTSLVLLDEAFDSVPPDAPGEIFVGGSGLARGYLNRPDLTAERFVSDPRRGHEGERLYRTGDRARLLPDGTFDFLGRLDHQVKIRGYRIELGEVESALCSLEAIREAVVLVDDHLDERRLLAYVVCHDAHKATAEREIKSQLRATLPDYLVPARVLMMDALPLTTNGKVDRRALPTPDGLRECDCEPTTRPTDPIECRLCQIWRDLLRVRQVRTDDDFFDLGGDSILAARLFARIERDFGRDLSPAILFQAPTPAQLAGILRGGCTEVENRSLVPIQPRGSRPPLFCIHAGAGTVLLYNRLSTYLGQDQPLFGLQARGLYGEAVPHTSIEEMAEHYLAEIRTVQPNGPYYLLGFCFGGIIAFEMAQRLTADGEQVAFLGGINALSPRYERDRTSIRPSRRHRVMARVDSAAASRTKAPERIWSRLRLGRVVKTAKSRLQWLRFHVETLRGAVYVALERPLPLATRKHYFLKTNGKMARRYCPAAYAGRFVLFTATDLFADPKLGWEEFAQRGLVVEEIPGSHDTNRATMDEPIVVTLATRLVRHLSICREECDDDAPATRSFHTN